MSILSGIFPLDALIQTASTLIGQIGKARAAKAALASNEGTFSKVIEQSVGAKLVAQRDIDGNGFIDAAEFNGRKSEFNILDVNGDGKLTAQEISARYGVLLAHRQSESIVNRTMVLSDFDMSGGLSRSEMGVSAKEFSALDSNGDGELVRAELMQALAQRGGIRDL